MELHTKPVHQMRYERFNIALSTMNLHLRENLSLEISHPYVSCGCRFQREKYVYARAIDRFFAFKSCRDKIRINL